MHSQILLCTLSLHILLDYYYFLHLLLCSRGGNTGWDVVTQSKKTNEMQQQERPMFASAYGV